MGRLRFGKYDYAAFLSFIAYAICSTVIPLVLVDMGRDLAFPMEDGGMGLGGALHLGRSVMMVLAMLFCGFLSAWWGKRMAIGMALLLMGVGVAGCGLAPVYGVVLVLVAAAGLGEGVIEGLATPFVQDLHANDQPSRYINISHSFWCVGVIVVTLGAGALLAAGVPWRWVMAICGLSALVPAAMMLLPDRSGAYHEVNEKYPWREVCANAGTILKIPRFWLHFAAMFFAGGGEFCLTFWCATFIRLEFDDSAWLGGLGTALFSLGMFIGRIAAGWLVPPERLKALCIGASLLSLGVCLLFPHLQSSTTLLALLFFAGLGAAPLWPSIQSYSSTRMRVDNTMLFVLLSCAGVPGCGVFTLALGLLGDRYDLRDSFYIVPACFAVTIVLLLLDRRAGVTGETAPERHGMASGSGVEK